MAGGKGESDILTPFPGHMGGGGEGEGLVGGGENKRRDEGVGRRNEGRGSTEPVFLNVYGAQESIPRNEFRQPM